MVWWNAFDLIFEWNIRMQIRLCRLRRHDEVITFNLLVNSCVNFGMCFMKQEISKDEREATPIRLALTCDSTVSSTVGYFTPFVRNSFIIIAECRVTNTYSINGGWECVFEGSPGSSGYRSLRGRTAGVVGFTKFNSFGCCWQTKRREEDFRLGWEFYFRRFRPACPSPSASCNSSPSWRGVLPWCGTREAIQFGALHWIGYWPMWLSPTTFEIDAEPLKLLYYTIFIPVNAAAPTDRP